jgi:SNF2 family DNA or RNA helicase
VTRHDYLWRHQQEAFDFLNPLGSGMLAMGMGSGKSATAVALCEAWDCKLVLIVTKKSVIPVWPQQIAEHGGSTWHVLPLDRGSVAERANRMGEAVKMARSSGDPLAVVTNYEAVTHTPLSARLKAVRWDALVLDECHSIKAPAGKQSRYLGNLAKGIPHRLGLTGTPMPHSPLDVYAQFRAIWPGLFGYTNAAFKARYAIYGGFQKQQIVNYQNLDDLHARMYQVTYRCRTEDVLDLPPTLDVNRYCDLEPATMKAYRELRDELIAEFDAGIVSADNALVKLLRLAQVANGTVTTADGRGICVGTEKAQLLEEVLGELKAGYDQRQEPLVIFCRFHADMDTTHRVCDAMGLGTCELAGRGRSELAAWQAGQAPVLVAQFQSGAEGNSFVRACYQVYYSNTYSLGQYEQTRARVHRPGQERPVTYIHLLARGTIDESLQKALQRKADIVRTVIDDMRGARRDGPDAGTQVAGAGQRDQTAGGGGQGPEGTAGGCYAGGARRLEL